jgi:hypothetical protein
MDFYPRAMPVSTQPAVGFFREVVGGEITTSWSDLTSALLEDAEAEYGPRDPRWFFTGIQFWDEGYPATNYPGGRPFHVGISLTREAATNPKLAYYQLAHEIVHVLGPSETFAPANVLEEGMAYRFQDGVNVARGLGMTNPIASYVDARAALDAMLAIEPNAVRIIRAVHPDVRNVTAAELMQLIPGLSANNANSLCSTFVRGE